MKKPATAVAAVLPVIAMVATLAGCGATDGVEATSTLRVYAAASLTDTFTELGKQFEAEHKDVTVAFNFAGSSDLVSQIEQGAPADVFASADTKNMGQATAAGLVSSPILFAGNTLMIAVPPDNPAKIAGLADLARPGLKLVICAPQVPCGSATAKVSDQSGITLKPVSEEQSVTDVLNKVTSGQADAGLVYVTDVKSAGDKVMGIAFPESSAAVNEYPIGVVSTSKHPGLAEQFVKLVTGPAGQKVLAKAGFALSIPRVNTGN